MIRPQDVILFQGDSVTDCGRDQNATAANDGLGQGYVFLVASRLLEARPADGLKFFNRGINGNRVVDLYARIKGDVINLRPNVLSVLIGVNDTWHEFMRGNGVPVPKYERVYREFLAEVRSALPDCRFVLCEPFVLRCGVVTVEWMNEINARQAVVRKLAAEFQAKFVPFQSAFDSAAKRAPAEFWAGDGVHPTCASHGLMAKTWLETVNPSSP
ncbi:MAG TPA: SGNH/GDSL hydrolase family protein [Candidatus Limnocylindrales bacterium]|nr:SGNH/GDSL hydrolase family protein [Candidatus Limnocylindrales bacterium]